MAAVALWIVWVAPYVLRNGRQRLQTAGETTGHAADFETQEPQAGPALMLAVQQEKPMDNLHGKPPGPDTSTALGRRGDSSTSQGHLRIKYGRCTIALLGLVMLFAVPVTGILCLAGIASIWFPVIALFGTAFSILLLRRLAVRDRRRRLRAAFRAAMSAPLVEAAADALTPSQPGREPQLFDAEAGKQAPPPPLSASELRQAALAVAAEAGDTSAPTGDPVEAGTDEPWQPVELPKPTYVEAAKAERPAPEPLDLPEAPKPVGRPSLKQGAAQSAAQQPTTAVSQEISGSSATQQAGGTSRNQSALSNLDDVLQRRRA
jgi:hypothetical protein